MTRLQRRGVRSYFTLLHPPTTTALLSLIVVASFTTPTFRLDRFILILVEIFLVVGVTANYLDEIKDRPWRTDIPESVLWAVGGAALVASTLIGLHLARQVGLWFMSLVAAWSCLTIAYSLELFGGRFHNAASLGLAVVFGSLGAMVVHDANLTWVQLTVALLSGIVAAYGRIHYELGKAAGRDHLPSGSARQTWRWLMLEVLYINAVAAVVILSRTLP